MLGQAGPCFDVDELHAGPLGVLVRNVSPAPQLECAPDVVKRALATDGLHKRFHGPLGNPRS